MRDAADRSSYRVKAPLRAFTKNILGSTIIPAGSIVDWETGDYADGFANIHWQGHQFLVIEGVDPYNLLVFTNHPQHYSVGDIAAPKDHWAALVSNNPRVKVFKQSALTDLLKALDLYGNIPTDFPKLVPGTNIPA